MLELNLVLDGAGIGDGTLQAGGVMSVAEELVAVRSKSGDTNQNKPPVKSKCWARFTKWDEAVKAFKLGFGSFRI
ncbi:MAG: hypothetical protein IPL01_21790 [Acidobacteria bacterium]|nr:hypothetical protein [Acidobacteriota bacterium]